MDKLTFICGIICTGDEWQTTAFDLVSSIFTTIDSAKCNELYCCYAVISL